jgi:hypothetical protein
MRNNHGAEAFGSKRLRPIASGALWRQSVHGGHTTRQRIIRVLDISLLV